MIRRLLFATVAVASAAVGCKCLHTPFCSKTSAKYIFTGRVEAQDMNYVETERRLAERTEELERLVSQKSEADLPRLRAIVGSILPEPFGSTVRQAATFEQFENAVDGWAVHGMWFRFRVFEVFNGPEERYVDVWIETNTTCSYRFAVGES